MGFPKKICVAKIFWEEERQVENNSREMKMSGGCKDFAATNKEEMRWKENIVFKAIRARRFEPTLPE